MKKLVVTFVMLIGMLGAFAQPYGLAMGGRVGPAFGGTAKYFLSNSAAVEGMVAGRLGGVTITGLYEIQKNVFKGRTATTEFFDSREFYWYYGGGVHVGFYQVDANNLARLGNSNFGDPVTIVGLDGILGVEYVVPEFPLCISLDVKPTFHFLGVQTFWGDEVGFSIRYVFY